MSIRIVARSIWQNPGNKGQRLQRTITAVRWQLHKRIRRTPQTIALASGCLFRAHPDCAISSALQYAAWPEFAELMFCRQRLTRGQVVIDVGANVGHIPLMLGDLVNPLDVFAFEPAPVAFKRLCENWRLNGWPTTQLLECAIGAVDTTMFIANEASPVSTNAVRVTSANGDVAVRAQRLDSLRHLWTHREIGLLKIDVEGYEPMVLSGGRLLLREDRPRLIMFESLGRTLLPEIAKLLDEADYIPLQLNGGGQPAFSDFSAQNLFAIPLELKNALCTSTGLR